MTYVGPTPQNLDDLIAKLMTLPGKTILTSGTAVIQDYMAQAFGAAILNAKDRETELMLQALFQQLIRRRS